jgi:phospholipase/carboxylesterase
MSDDATRPSKSETGPLLHSPGNRSQLQLPLHYEPKYAYPLVIWLNRDAFNPRNLSRFSNSLSLRNYVIAAPFLKAEWLEPTPSPNTAALVSDTINHTISKATQRINVHSKRIFLVTEQDTLLPALTAISQIKHNVRGVATVNEHGEMPIPTCTHMGKTLDSPPLLFCLPDAEGRMLEKIERTWRLYHSLGHSVRLKTMTAGSGFRNSALRNIDRWIMETITGQPAMDPQQAPEPNFCLN